MSDSDDTKNVPSKPRTGTVVKTRAGLWQGMVTLADGSRMRLKPPFPKGTSEAMAREKTAYWAEKFADKVRPPSERAPNVTSAEGWVNAWIADKAARGHTSMRDKRAHWNHHISPAMGGAHPKDWTEEMLRAFVRTLDEKQHRGEMSPKTARNIWGTCTSICKACVASKLDELRCRKDNPSMSVTGPDRGPEKEATFLYPSEFEKLMACDDVPIRFRRIVALAVFLGVRQSELAVLRWADVDLSSRKFRVHRSRGRDGTIKTTKSGKVRTDDIHENLLPLLAAMKAEAGDRELVLYDRPALNEFAGSLREYLEKAGCMRAEIHEDTETTKNLVFHDLRATYATWLALAGVDAWEMKDRIGHSNLSTTERYVRNAKLFRGRVGDPFPALPGSLWGGVSHAVSFTPDGFVNEVADLRKVDGRPQRDSKSTVTPENKQKHRPTPQGEDSPKGGDEAPNPAIPDPRALGACAPLDAVEQALASALEGATKAQQWDVVARLADELKARREARQAPNVVPLRRKPASS